MLRKTPSAKMMWFFLISIFLMVIHKYESFKTAEWDFAPGYLFVLQMGLGDGKMLFLTFVTMVFVLLFWSFIIIFTQTGKWLFLAFWGLTFLLEYHHLARALLAGSYYSGLYSAILYVLFGFFYWGEYFRNFYNRKHQKP